MRTQQTELALFIYLQSQLPHLFDSTGSHLGLKATPSFPLTKSRVLVVAAPVPSAAGRVVASGVERVVAVVRQVASLSVPTGASAGGCAVTHSDLTKLVVDLEPLHVELLHLLHGTTKTHM